MDAVKFLQERSRMYKTGAATPSIGLEDDYDPVIAVEIVEEWSAAHPRKTRQDLFLEQWPNADTMEDGTLIFSPCSVDRSCRSSLCNNGKCRDCRREFWGKAVE